MTGMIHQGENEWCTSIYITLFLHKKGGQACWKGGYSIVPLISHQGMGFSSLNLQQIKYGLENKEGFLN